jgi:hypothetical protein
MKMIEVSFAELTYLRHYFWTDLSIFGDLDYSMKTSCRIKKTTPWHQSKHISFRNIHEKREDSSEDDTESNQDHSRSSNDDLETDVGLEGNKDIENNVQKLMKMIQTMMKKIRAMMKVI